MDEKNTLKKGWIVRLAAASVLGISIYLFYATGSLQFVPDAPQLLWTKLLALLAIALVVERSLEVIITTWRYQGSEILNNRIISLERKLLAATSSGSGNVERLRLDTYKASDDKALYSAETRAYAMWISLGIGIFLGLAGVRILGSAMSNIESLDQLQRTLFTVLDIILTGGLIAGGSEAIHKITKLYQDFFETKSNNIRIEDRENKINSGSEANPGPSSPSNAEAALAEKSRVEVRIGRAS